MWTLLLPLIQILLFWFVFSAVLEAKPYPDVQVPFIYFLLSSFFFWLCFSEGILRCASVVLENAEVIKKISFPLVLMPVTATVSIYVQHLIGFIVFLIIYGLYTSFDLIYLLLIPVVFFQFILSLGLGMILSALVPYVRDIVVFLGHLVQGAFFLSPIIYSLEAIPKQYQPLFYLNPMTYFAESYHAILLLKSLPSFHFLLFVVIGSTIIFFSGFFLFKKLKEGFADVL